MKRILMTAAAGAIATGFMVAGFAGPAYAPKPRDSDGNFLGNGYPSGTHYNLNLLGKKDNFTCPAPKYEVLVDVNGDGDVGTGQTLAECEAEGDTCGDQVFGNVIFMPRNEDGSNTDPISIYIESGAKGPKGKPTLENDLEVTDWCTESFPNDGSSPPPLGDGATFRLPKDEEGYAVYARIVGKPNKDNDGPTFEFASGSLFAVEDEFGNDMLLLGLVTPDGTFGMIEDFEKTAEGLGGGVCLADCDPDNDGDGVCETDETCTTVELSRTSGEGGGQGKGGPKGAKKATEITQIFEYTGEVCYLNDIDFFCPGYDPLNEEGDSSDCTARTDPLCCVAADLVEGGVDLAETCLDADGFAACEDSATDAGECLTPISIEITVEDNDAPGGDNDGVCEVDETCTTVTVDAGGLIEDLSAIDDPDNDFDGICEVDETCIENPVGEACAVFPVCKNYVEEWVFNIADFVTVLFGVENDGSYNVKLRFYPLPLDIDAQQ